MCISKCTGDEFMVHSIGCNGKGKLVCLECGSLFTMKELKKAFEERFDWKGEFKLSKLLKLAGAIKRIADKYPQVANQFGEAQFYIDPPVNAIDHTRNTLSDGRHFYIQSHE